MTPDRSTDFRAVRVFVRGKVQGVWYRAWTKGEAQRLGLHGFVRNRKDGRVEALLSGPACAVDELIALMGEGPPQADVIAVDVEAALGRVPGRFEVKPTV